MLVGHEGDVALVVVAEPELLHRQTKNNLLKSVVVELVVVAGLGTLL